MARLMTETWDAPGIAAAPGGNFGVFNCTAAYDTANVIRKGRSCAFTQTAGGASGFSTVAGTPGDGVPRFYRAYIRLPVLPAARCSILLAGSAGYSGGLHVDQNGAVSLWQHQTGGVGADTQIGSASANGLIRAGIFACYEVCCILGTGSVDYLEGRINGAVIAAQGSLNITDTFTENSGMHITSARGTNPGNGFVITADEAAVDDAVFPGPVTDWPSSNVFRGLGGV